MKKCKLKMIRAGWGWMEDSSEGGGRSSFLDSGGAEKKREEEIRNDIPVRNK